jgi:hypothetical protein
VTEPRESLSKELTRRRVVQVALLYFAIAWTVTEVLSFLFEAIPVFPAWSKTLVALLFVLGFPVAMFLAWRFDIEPGGIRRTEGGTSRGRLTVIAAVVDAIRAQIDADRQALQAPGDELPPCVSNMRVTAK